MEEMTLLTLFTKYKWVLVKFAQFNRWNMPSSDIYIFMPQVSNVIILDKYSSHKNRVKA